MIDMFGVVGVGLGVLWDCMGRIGVGGGDWSIQPYSVKHL